MSTSNGIAAVALDIDGTLARDDHQVSPDAIGVLEEFEAAGIRPIMVTGRLESSSENGGEGNGRENARRNPPGSGCLRRSGHAAPMN